MFHKNKHKIFCISYQKNGTTSVGEFFKKNGFRVAGWKVSNINEWSMNWLKGEIDKIFKSKDFKAHQVFEDDPWFLPEFYKVLYHKFPDAKFILVERNSDSWFKSLMNHQDGKTLGNTEIHSKIYKREKEFLDLVDKEEYDLLVYDFETKKNWFRLNINESLKDHYINCYETYNKEVKYFFNFFDKERIIYLNLEDEFKWEKLAKFFQIKIPKGFNVHVNKGVYNKKLRKLSD